jgi:hypothetical protein
MAARHQKENEWKTVKKRCRLNDKEVNMAKELGISPRSLIKNIPSPSQRWKLPVKEWVRNLHFKKFGRRRLHADVTNRSPALRDGNGFPPRFLVDRTEPDPVDPNADIDIPF